MYTAIRKPDGSLRFELHVGPETLTPAEAREALARFESLLSDLRRRAEPQVRPPAKRAARPSERRSGVGAGGTAPL